MATSPITTHVLDTALGHPAAGVPVKLDRVSQNGCATIATGVTNDDGRLTDLLPEEGFEAGDYCLTFDTSAYYEEHGRKAFYPTVAVHFTVCDTAAHYHVPLLLSPFGYSTYRGS